MLLDNIIERPENANISGDFRRMIAEQAFLSKLFSGINI